MQGSIGVTMPGQQEQPLLRHDAGSRGTVLGSGGIFLSIHGRLFCMHSSVAVQASRLHSCRKALLIV